MPIFGQQLDGLCYVAWNTSTNAPQTGDASNHSLRIIRDGVESIPSNSPFEVDASGAPGLYKINLSPAEMSAQILTLAGRSATSSVIIVPVQITTTAAAALTSYVNSGNANQIWSESQLDQWSRDAAEAIAIDVNCIWQRECITITAGESLVTLPSYVKTLSRVTYRGKTLTCVSWEEMQMLSPGTAILTQGSSANIETTRSRPEYYAMHPTNAYDIRLFPTPSESFTISGEPDPYAPTPNSPSCIISFWRIPDTSNTDPIISLPTYIYRRTMKAYVLWKAFAAEGKGQDINASNYYKMKYDFLINQFRSINEGCYVSKRYTLGESVDHLSGRYPKPTLGPNFERVIF